MKLSVIVLSSVLSLTAFSQDPLRVMMIFAHPDEGEVYSGGITALYTQLGYQVKFLSLTNGDAGHFTMKPEDLAKRRYQEAMKAKEILKLAEYEILDYHDGNLQNTAEIQQKVASRITQWKADVVFTFYPAQGGHNDNMTAGWIVRDAVSILDDDELPVFMYVRDFHTSSFSYIPDIAVAIDEVWDLKLAGLGAHVSQVLEFNPHQMGTFEEVQKSTKLQEEYLYNNAYDWSHMTPEVLTTLQYWYGKDRASKMKYVEAYEVAEFGRQPTKEELITLFPMIKSTFNSNAP
jgi:LmbE family N-acetylglucosaminyl deacetylase